MTVRLPLAIFALALLQLACLMSAAQIPTPTRPAASATIPVPAATGTPSAVATVAEAERATVRAAAVNIRSTPEGSEVVGQVIAGADVTLLEPCKDEWCHIRVTIGDKVVTGFMFQGCLSVAMDGQKCEAAK